jgi:hypothetical protein
MAVLGTSVLAIPSIPAFSGPFSYADMENLVPEDKKLSLAWINSLTERGKPEVYSSENGELNHIGIPVGGIACGQLYLGGDGRMWLWHIFKTEYSRENRPVDKGTVVKVTDG